jgi:hypothetical protein
MAASLEQSKSTDLDAVDPLTTGLTRGAWSYDLDSIACRRERLGLHPKPDVLRIWIDLM